MLDILSYMEKVGLNPMYKCILGINALLLFLANQVLAITAEPSQKLCNIFFSASVVAHVKIIERSEIVDAEFPENAPAVGYKLDVIKSYRGSLGHLSRVVSESGPSMLTMDKGKEYIIFAYQSDGGLFVFNTWGEVQHDAGEPYSKKLEARIERMLSEKSSSIEGEVRDVDWNLLPNINLSVEGNNLAVNVKTNSKGYFSIEVPPGKYNITSKENLAVTSYSPNGMGPDPTDLKFFPKEIVAGECEQIQFMRK